jgi:hypothetical protein
VTAPAVLAVAGPLTGCCRDCGERIEPGSIAADFHDAGGDRWRWRCPACTARHVRRQAQR